MLANATHRAAATNWLTKLIDNKHTKTKKTQKFIAVVDPEREKEVGLYKLTHSLKAHGFKP